MMKQYLRIEALVIDNDEAKFKISTGNGIATSSLEIFGYVDEFKKFGEDLKSFPKDSNDVRQYELGSGNEDWAYYLLIKVFCYDSTGYTAIQIKINNKQDVPDLLESNFYLKTYPSSVNELGESLFNWRPDKDAMLECVLENIN